MHWPSFACGFLFAWITAAIFSFAFLWWVNK
jgi:hypothetical protein